MGPPDSPPNFLPTHLALWVVPRQVSSAPVGFIYDNDTEYESVSGMLVQAWVGHSHNYTHNPTLGLPRVLVYIRQVKMTKQDHNTQHKHTTNTTIMVVEPPTPPVSWI